MRLVAVLIALFFVAPALADGSSRPHGMGGAFRDYAPIIARYNKSGERFRIEGRCQSSCTLFLGIRNVCVDPDARLFFHAGLDRRNRISAASTAYMLRHYNAKLRAYLADNHAMEKSSFFAISGRDMISKFGYRACR
ncbi:MAG TPA: hypothetical protein VHD34_02565 [Xanthobacteraceae bacterium]|nr:hypothetical protein [Xanthobacteraceae bacterium]